MADSRRLNAAADRGTTLTFVFDGQNLTAHAGETLATALHAAGRSGLRSSAKLGAPRGVFCNMGICYDCLVYVEQGPESRPRAMRSCMVLVADGMRVSTWRPRPDEPKQQRRGHGE